MATCVVCTQLAQVFCLADKCFLCTACDKTIHEANIISRGHRRLPTCALCKRSAAAVYCKEDEAALCTGCEVEVHAANPLGVSHQVVPIETAMATGLLAPAGAAASPAQPAAAGPAPPAEDAQSSAHVSACPNSAAELLNSSTDVSFVVPDMAATSHALPTIPMPNLDPGLKGLKDFEEWDWGGLDMNFDFSDILGNEDLPGMVPTVDAVLSAPAPAAPVKPEPTVVAPPPPVFSFSHPSFEDEFAVPSFLPDDLVEELEGPASSVQGFSLKREASEIEEPPAKKPVLAPAPPPVMPPAVTTSRPETRQSSAPGGQSLLHMNGANLTREQRVARYREKRKNRKFQKTIRYASRKAYAEVRPRIKGRFATKEEVEAWKAAKAAGLPDPTGISAANPTMA